jgi:hypothetical protein
MGNKSSFKKSNTPWNKDKKGIHLSPETEFKKDQNVGKNTLLGKVVFKNPRMTVRICMLEILKE